MCKSLDRYLLITSPAILEEVVEVLSRPDLLRSKAIGAIDATRVINLLRHAPLVTPTVTVTVCRDPDDNKFLEAAVAAKAEYIVTGDEDLRSLDEFEGTRIRYPGEFLRELTQSSS